MTALTIALDWTPNVNHIGFFVAKENGFYADLGLDVSITTPADDNYQVTPAKKVELGDADFALCPTESVISYQTKSEPFPLTAIAALLQTDLSAIVTKQGVGINSPKDLDGKLYASYQARYEDGIVMEMIKNDGGNGDLKIVYPEKLGIWDTVIEGTTDATWIFENWEGVEAQNAGLPLNYFHLRDYNIPYSYSPVLVADGSKITANRDAYRAFLQATKKGFLYCQDQKKEVVDILRTQLIEDEKDFDLASALDATSSHFGDEQGWGRIDESVLNTFLMWLRDKDLEHSEITATELFTNECLG